VGGLSRRAAFVDRDGTINVRAPEHQYVTSADEFVWLPGAVEGLVRLDRAGYVLSVVSNQRGVARGLVTREVLAEIEGLIGERLAEHDCAIAAFRYCFHDEWENCDCRKPKPGMLLDLARDLDLELPRSWMIGDSDSDISAGRAAGTMTASTDPARAPEADVVTNSLAAAAELIAGRTVQPASEADSASKPSTSD
jgi:D-glycero-D-manno-heptose 1,7-bisphosphate phosphatase